MSSLNKLPKDDGILMSLGAVASLAALGVVVSRTGSAGRRYQASEWVEFIGPYQQSGGEPSAQTLKLAKKFGAQAMRRAEAWKQQNHPDAQWDLEEDDVAFRAFASATGHGVGLWDGELFYRQGVQRDKSYVMGQSIEKALSVRQIQEMAARLQESMHSDVPYQQQGSQNRGSPFDVARAGKKWKITHGQYGSLVMSGFRTKKEALSAVYALDTARYDHSQGRVNNYITQGQYGYTVVYVTDPKARDGSVRSMAMSRLTRQLAKDLAISLKDANSGMYSRSR